MKKTLILLVMLIGILILLSSCECMHKTYERETFSATCDQKGYSTYTCVDCGYSFVADIVAPLGHKFETTVVEAKCETEGYTLNHCTVCNYDEKINIVSAKNHTFSNVKTVKATCTGNGYSYSVCEECGTKKTFDFVAQLQHDYQKTLTKPTCEAEGYTTYKCKNCSFSYKSDYTQPTGHKYEKTYVRPNIEENGYTIYTCSECKTSHKSDFIFWNDVFNGAAGEGKGIIAKGVDISYHNGNVDFNQLKANGIDFVIIRIGSSNGKDSKFETYYQQAKAAGLLVGGYFFTYSTDANGAKQDAIKTIDYIDGKKFEYPIFFDIEDYETGEYFPSTLSETVLMSMTKTYITTLIANNYYAGLYTNYNWIHNHLDYEETLQLYDVWFARYPDADKIDYYVDMYTDFYSIWQYSESEKIGTMGEFDVNYSFKDYYSIIKKYGFNGY